MIQPGTKLAHYEIVSALGKGGMGEVWRAKDAKLGREVAIKTLAAEFSQDSDRLARFEREAKLLASLNHSNIAAIYGLEEHEDCRFLVLELVEGDTLGDRIKRGTLPVEESLRIALQIADALKAAHETGVVHRDLKPDNVKINEDGTVKVLDFGLAKAVEGDAAETSASNSPTLSMAATKAGIILGTAAYMSPEQAKGRVADRRADVFAFGCVLYEMVTGRQSFGKSDVTESLSAVISLQPDWTALPTNINPRLREIIERCLEKTVAKRYQDIGDVRADIEKVRDNPVDGQPERVASNKRYQKLLWIASVVALVVTAATLLVTTLPTDRNETPPRTVRFSIAPPPNSSIPVGTPAISADGTIAYSVVDPDGVRRLHTRSIGSLEDSTLFGTEGAVHPFFAPSGASLAFAFLGGGEIQIRIIELEEGGVRDVVAVSGPWHGTWSMNNEILYQDNPTIGRIPAGGGTRLPAISLGSGEDAAASPYFLPDGNRYLLRVQSGERSSIQLGRLDSTARTVVKEDVFSAPILAPTPGGRTYLVYMDWPLLMAQQFDEETESVVGDAAVVVNGIARVGNPPLTPAVGVSPNGILAYQIGGSAEFGRLTWLDREGSVLEQLPAEISVGRPRLSTDGGSVAGVRTSLNGADELWVIDLMLRLPTRVASGRTRISHSWSPGSDQLTYTTLGTDGVRTIDVASLAEQVLIEPTASDEPRDILDWSPNGQYMLVQDGSAMAMVAVDGTQELFRVGTPAGTSSQGRFAPNGDYIAFTSVSSDQSEVWIQATPPETGLWRVSPGAGDQPRWRADSTELYYQDPVERRIMAVPLRVTSTGLERGNADELFPGYFQLGYDVSLDGQRFLVSSNFIQENEPESFPINVVVDWWVELESRLGLR